MNFLLDILKQDYISNVYIGVTGILVALIYLIRNSFNAPF